MKTVQEALKNAGGEAVRHVDEKIAEAVGEARRGLEADIRRAKDALV